MTCQQEAFCCLYEFLFLYKYWSRPNGEKWKTNWIVASIGGTSGDIIAHWRNTLNMIKEIMKNAIIRNARQSSSSKFGYGTHRHLAKAQNRTSKTEGKNMKKQDE